MNYKDSQYRNIYNNLDFLESRYLKGDSLTDLALLLGNIKYRDKIFRVFREEGIVKNKNLRADHISKKVRRTLEKKRKLTYN